VRGLVRAIAVAGAVALLALGALFAWRRQPCNAIVIAPGGEMQYDDFAVSVEGVRRVPTLGEGEARLEARGEFVVVTLGVHNHARRVDYAFKPETLELATGPEGRGFGPVAAAKPLLAAGDGCDGPISAGAACSIELAFDVPAGTQGLALRLRSSGALLDALDTLVYGRMCLALPDG